MIEEFIQSDSIYDYLTGLKKFPEKYGILDVSGKSSKSDISYYDWDLTFADDMKANRPDNSGKDEIQIIFNLNEPIEWDVLSDAKGKRNIHVKMDAGEVCIYRNNDAKTGMFYPANTTFRFKSLQMSTERFNRLISANFDKKEGKLLQMRVFAGVEKTSITPLMYKIMSEIDGADLYREYKAAFLEAKLTELTILVMYGALNDPSKEEKKKRNISPEDKRAVMHLHERIHLAPHESYYANDIAAELSMSVSKLNRIFRKLYETSLHSYVTEQRLEYSVSLMDKESCTVSEAAYRSGYNNLSHFARAFSQKYGMTPRQFLKK